MSKARAHLLAPEGIRGAPDMVVEITSPSTAERDRTIKRKLYARHGVRVYWFANHQDEFVDVWDLESGAREPVRHRDRLPVVIGRRSYDVISLPDIFAPES